MLIDLAKNYNKGALQISEISKKEDVSEKYLGQISIILKNNKIIDSVRGSQGGFFLTKPPENFNLKDLVEILEGDLQIVNCSFNNRKCEKILYCITKKIWEEVSLSIKNTLSKYTLLDLVKMQEKEADNMFYI